MPSFSRYFVTLRAQLEQVIPSTFQLIDSIFHLLPVDEQIYEKQSWQAGR
jgi:hypothetical protein